jgi:hypothetical protein
LSREYGDFQTPLPLVEEIIASLNMSGKRWTRVLEPTCGRGNFIQGLLKQAVPPAEIVGIEIQKAHVDCACLVACEVTTSQVSIKHADFFTLNLQQDIQWKQGGPLLVLGNPPWVTNAELGVLGSNNLPRKRNIKGLQGLEALTGKANFDIAEYIWLKLMKELASEEPTIALLCKTSVARNILQFASDTNLRIRSAFIRKIDAKKWFGAAVEACLFCVEMGTGEQRLEIPVYPDLFTITPEYVAGIVKGGQLVMSVAEHQRIAHIEGVSPLTWRQGVKHDAASIMELVYNAEGMLHNKLGELVIVEPDYVYPLLKGSDLFSEKQKAFQKAVLVTQKCLGEDTRALERIAPQLWQYLNTHREVFQRRKSSIYQGKPAFSMFGIGDYSFAPYKVGISGLHKAPRFRAIGLQNGKPVMLDDTCYFLPCSSAEQAAFLTSLLNDPLCKEFIRSIAFIDAKRPITKKLLQRIDLRILYEEVDHVLLKERMLKELQGLGAAADLEAIEKCSLERYFVEYPDAETTKMRTCYAIETLFPDDMTLAPILVHE